MTALAEPFGLAPLDGGGASAPAVSTRATPIHVAVLATIIQRSSHVYDVAKRFERRFGREIVVTDRRIYQVVDDLLDAGLVVQAQPSAEECRRRRRAPRRPVRATAVGAATYRRWLVEQAVTRPHDVVGLRVGLSAALMRGSDAALDMLRRYEEVLRRELATIGVTPGDIAAELLAEQRRMTLEAGLRWAALAQERLNSAVFPEGAS